tara:strand:- start:3201 stop:4562 length:1362 start_codon:yes stop_codon:yes gene_type:complete
MLSVDELFVKKFNNLLISHLNLTVKRGQILEISGVNGSGKTSLIKVLAGISQQLKGKHNGEKFERYFIPSAGGFRDELKPTEIIQHLTDCDKKGAENRLKEVGLAAVLDIQSGDLSDGQKKRILLASLSKSSNGILFADEPFNSLDDTGKKLFLSIVQNFLSNDGIVVIATHIPLKELLMVHDVDISLESCCSRLSLNGNSKHSMNLLTEKNITDDSNQLSFKSEIPSLFDYFKQLISFVKRELSLLYKKLSDVTLPLVFLWMLITILPFGVGQDPDILRNIASGAIWFGTVIVMIFATIRIFELDFNSGAIEQLIVRNKSIPIYCLTKSFTNWLFLGLTISVVSIPLGIIYDLGADAVFALFCSLVIGTLAISNILTILAALGLMARQAQVLVGILAFPLIVPLIVFGSAIVETSFTGTNPFNLYSVLLGVSLLTTLILPAICTNLIKLALD